MTTSESLEKLRTMARSDRSLREKLLATRDEREPLRAFCEIGTEAGCPLSPMDVLMFGEESYAAMRRSTNGGGENSPLLAWEDDYYELFMAELEAVKGREDH
jgi:hypothetical protein